MRHHPMDEERRPLAKMGYSVYPAKDLPKGLVIKSTDLVIKSPADGLPGWAYDELIGKTLLRDVNAEEILDWSYFSGEF